MNYIIFDLEWNQPQDASVMITEPILLEGEIVELGAVKLDAQFRPIDEFRMYVKPKYYTKMHKRIAALTGIHDRDIAEKGVPFPQMYEAFIKWCGDEYIFMTWSMSDLLILIDNMTIHNMETPALPPFCDVQRIFSREIMRANTRYSLETAMALLNECGDAAHDALHDARNTSKVCDHLDLNQYIEEYISGVFVEKPDGIHYKNRKTIFEESKLRQTQCPWCGQVVSCEPWVCSGNNTYLGYCLCPEGDEFLIELSVARNQEGAYLAKRIVFEMSDDLWDIYMDRKEELGLCYA